MMNYRKLYEKQLNIKIPKEYVIHHIDENRENNQLTNLVMLPNKLHKKYHDIKKHIQGINFEFNFKLMRLGEPGIGMNSCQVCLLNEFLEIWNECQEYVFYRDYLRGELPKCFDKGIIDFYE